MINFKGVRMKSTRIIYIFLFFSSITFTSCSQAVLRLYGIKSIKEIDETAILKYGKKFNIPNNDSYEVDTAYLSYLMSLDTIKNHGQIKNHYQPLQALYYNSNGTLESFHVNCYASGFPNLIWDKDDLFNTFIPKQQAPLDSIVPLATQLKYLKPLSKTSIISTEDFEYVIVVHWNRFMGRQSKRLIKIVQENVKLSEDVKVKFVYANSDNMHFLAKRNDVK